MGTVYRLKRLRREVQILFVNVGPVSNRTIPIKSGSTVLILLSLLKRLRVDRYSKCCFICFLSTTHEGGLLSFLFFVTEVEKIATKVGVRYASFCPVPPAQKQHLLWLLRYVEPHSNSTTVVATLCRAGAQRSQVFIASTA